MSNTGCTGWTGWTGWTGGTGCTAADAVVPALGVQPQYQVAIPAGISLEDIRLFLIDRSADDNFLLDALEYSDQQIWRAMVFCTDKYNSMPPLVNLLAVTQMPHWLLITGTSAILLRSQAINYARNKLDYQSKDGTAVQDKNKSQEYMALSKQLMDEFERGVAALKRAANIQAAYGYVGSPYRTPGGGGY